MAAKKKIIATVATVATSAALLLGGTLAWQSVSQTALNEASDVVNPGGRLHDDFDGENKDVYVENFAEEDIYARIRLEEFFEIIVNYGTEAEKAYPVIGSKTLKDGAVEDPENNPSGANLYDYEYVLHNFTTADNQTEDAGIDPADGAAYWKWTLGGQTVYMPTFNMNKDSLAADLNGEYVDAVGGISNRDGTQYANYTEYAVGDEATDTEIYDDDVDTNDEVGRDFDNLANYSEDIVTTENQVHTAKETLTSTLISMQEWIDAGANPGPFWVYDEDGWVYWADAIKPGTATGLLLDGIELTEKMDDTWYYAINVVAQFITANDLGKTDGTGFYDTSKDYPVPSDNALILLEAIGVDVSGEASQPGEDEPQTYDLILTADGANTVNATTADSFRIGFDESGLTDDQTADTTGVVVYQQDAATFSLRAGYVALDGSRYSYTDGILSLTDDTLTGTLQVMDLNGVLYGFIQLPDGSGGDDDGDFADSGTLQGINMSLYSDSENIKVNEKTNTLRINPEAGWTQVYVNLEHDTLDIELGDTEQAIYEWSETENAYIEHDESVVDIEYYSDGLDLDLNSGAAGRYKLTASYSDDQGNTYQGEIEFTIEIDSDFGGGSEDPAYEVYIDPAKDAYTSNANDSVNFSIYVYDAEYELVELDNTSVSWTVAGDENASIATNPDGSATLTPGAATQPLTVTAVYTDGDGNEYTSEPVTLYAVYEASQYLTLDGEKTNVVHPGNSYELAYEGENGPYSFALAEDGGVAALPDDTTLEISPTAEEHTRIGITVSNAGGEVETVYLTVTHDLIIKVVAPEERNVAVNGTWAEVYQDETISAYMGNDNIMTLTANGISADATTTLEDAVTVSGDGTQATFHRGNTAVSMEAVYTPANGAATFSFEDGTITRDLRIQVLFAHSVSVEYSLNGGDRQAADDTAIFLSEDDTITFYAESDAPADDQPAKYSWKIGENGSEGTLNETAFGELLPTEGSQDPNSGVSVNTSAEYSIADISAMEPQLDYHFYVSADSHNHAWFQVIYGEVQIDGSDTIEVGGHEAYSVNDLKRYTFTVSGSEYAEISQYGDLTVTEDIEIGTVLTLTATPNGHDGNVLTKEVTVVEAEQEDYSEVYLSVYDDEDNYDFTQYDPSGEQTVYFDATVSDIYGDSVDLYDNDGLVWYAEDGDGNEITEPTFVDNRDGAAHLDIALLAENGYSGEITVTVTYTGEDAGENNTASWTLYPSSGGDSSLIHLDHIEMYYGVGSFTPSVDGSGNPVALIDSSGMKAVYLAAYAYDEDTGDTFTYDGEVEWTSNSEYLDEDSLALGLIRFESNTSMSGALEPITVTASSQHGSADFTVYLYNDAVHSYEDTVDTGLKYHLFRADGSDNYCVYRESASLPYCLMELTLNTDEEYIYELAYAYDKYLVDPTAEYPDVAYVGICPHPDGDGNYPQDEPPMFSVSNEDTGDILASAMHDGDGATVMPGARIQITSTRLDGEWDISAAVEEQSESVDQYRSRLFFTVPEDAEPGSAITITQTMNEGEDNEESYSISLSIADPGPTFTVYLNGEQIAAGVREHTWTDLPIFGLTEDAVISVTSTYPTQDEDWEASDEYANYYDGYVDGEYGYTFTVPAGNDLVSQDSIFVYQYANDRHWTLYLNVTEPAQEPEPDANASMHMYFYQPSEMVSGDIQYLPTDYLQPGVTYKIIASLSPYDETFEGYMNTGLDFAFTVTDMDDSVVELTDYTLTHSSGAEDPTFSDNRENFDSHDDVLVFDFTPGESVQYGTWINIKAETDSDEVIASYEHSMAVTQDEVELNVKLYDTDGNEVSDYFVAENASYDLVATLERNGESYTVHSSNEEQYPLSENIAAVYDENHYIVLHSYNFMEGQAEPQVTLNEDGTITVGTDDPDHQGTFAIVITVNDLRILDSDGAVTEHLYAKGQTNYYFNGESPLVIDAYPITVDEYDFEQGREVHILNVYEDGFETTLSANYKPQLDFIPVTDAVYEIVSDTDSCTLIDGDRLIIGQDETAAQIIIRATSAEHSARGEFILDVDYTKPWYVLVDEITPGSAETINLDGVDWYVVSKEDGVAQLFAANAVANMAWDADGVRDDGLHPFSYTDSDVVNYLNGEFLDTLNTVRDYLVPSNLEVWDFPVDASTTSDEIRITLDDPNAPVTVPHDTASYDDFEHQLSDEIGQSMVADLDVGYTFWTDRILLNSDGIVGRLRFAVYDDGTITPSNLLKNIALSSYVHPVIFVDLNKAGSGNEPQQTAYTITLTSSASQYPVGGNLEVAITAEVIDNATGEPVTVPTPPDYDPKASCTINWGEGEEGLGIDNGFTALADTTGKSTDFTATFTYDGCSESITITAVPNEEGEPTFAAADKNSGDILGSNLAPGSVVEVTPDSTVQIYSTNNSYLWDTSDGYIDAGIYNSLDGASGSFINVNLPYGVAGGTQITVTQTVGDEEYSIILDVITDDLVLSYADNSYIYDSDSSEYLMYIALAENGSPVTREKNLTGTLYKAGTNIVVATVSENIGFELLNESTGEFGFTLKYASVTLDHDTSYDLQVTNGTYTSNRLTFTYHSTIRMSKEGSDTSNIYWPGQTAELTRGAEDVRYTLSGNNPAVAGYALVMEDGETNTADSVAETDGEWILTVGSGTAAYQPFKLVALDDDGNELACILLDIGVIEPTTLTTEYYKTAAEAATAGYTVPDGASDNIIVLKLGERMAGDYAITLQYRNMYKYVYAATVSESDASADPYTWVIPLEGRYNSDYSATETSLAADITGYSPLNGSLVEDEDIGFMPGAYATSVTVNGVAYASADAVEMDGIVPVGTGSLNWGYSPDTSVYKNGVLRPGKTLSISVYVGGNAQYPSSYLDLELTGNTSDGTYVTKVANGWFTVTVGADEAEHSLLTINATVKNSEGGTYGTIAIPFLVSAYDYDMVIEGLPEASDDGTYLMTRDTTLSVKVTGQQDGVDVTDKIASYFEWRDVTVADTYTLLTNGSSWTYTYASGATQTVRCAIYKGYNGSRTVTLVGADK